MKQLFASRRMRVTAAAPLWGWRWTAAGVRVLLLMLVAALLLEDGSTALSLEETRDNATEDIIVVLPEGMATSQAVHSLDVDVTHRYTTVFNGFAAEVSPEARRELEQIPGVIVSPNRPVEEMPKAAAKNKHSKKQRKQERKKDRKKERKQRRNQNSPPVDPPPVGPPPVSPPPAPSTQIIPTGVRRIAADQNPQAGIRADGGAIDVDVAVFDTGIAPHPDLTIAGGQACTSQGTEDVRGHGTHVAGTIGALDNTFGVVGIAPGARLHAVKVLANNGSGTSANLICGLDWVLANAATIDVVNMSLGGDAPPTTCTDDAVHFAVCRVVAAGIPVIVAAGNDGADAANQFPANYPEVITVSALSDFDGLPGGAAPATCFNNGDDTFASYSNFGADVDIVAPGTCILSTSVGGGYDTLSGTSMATPHVTGAAALYLAINPLATADSTRAYLLGPSGSRSQQSPQGIIGNANPGATSQPVLYIPTAAPAS